MKLSQSKFLHGILIGTAVLSYSLVINQAIAKTNPIKKDTVRFINEDEVKTLNPYFNTGDQAINISQNIFTGLVTADENGKKIPGIAKSWGVSKNGKTYTFHLRNNLKWSDGTSYNAHDIVESFLYALDPKTASTNVPPLLAPVKGATAYNSNKGSRSAVGIKAVNPHTVQITLIQPTAYFLSSLENSQMVPLPLKVMKKYGKSWMRTHFVGNGPYKVAEFKYLNHLKLVRNKYFYDQKGITINNVFFYPVANRDTALNMMITGKADIMQRFASNQISLINKHIPKFLNSGPIMAIYQYVFNTTRPPFNNKDVRLAISMVINRKIITNKILKTGETPAYNLIPSKTENYLPGAKSYWAKLSYAGRIKEAKRLLAKAGYTAKHPLQFTLSYNTTSDNAHIAVAARSMMMAKHLPVKMKIATAEWKSHIENIDKGNFDMARIGQGGYNDPFAILRLFVSEKHHFINHSRYSNKKYDDLIIKANKLTDFKKRAKLLQQAEQIILDDSPSAVLYFFASKDLSNPNLSGYVVNPPEDHPIRFMHWK